MFSQEERFENLEKRVKSIEEKMNISALPLIIPSSVPPTGLIQNSSREVSDPKEPTENKPDSSNRFSLFLRYLMENWPAKLGVLLIFLSVSWFMGYCFMHGWLSERSRFFLCFSLSTGLFGYGAFCLSRNMFRGGIFTSLGSVCMILSLWQGGASYHLFSQILCLAYMTLVIGSTFALSLKFKSRQIAFSVIFIANLIPQLFYTGDLSSFGLKIYFLLIDSAALSGFLIYGWTRPFLAACVGLWVYPYLCHPIGEFYCISIFLFIFLIPWLFNVICSKQKKENFVPNGILITVISLITIYFSMHKIDKSYQNIAFSAAAFLALVPVFLLSKKLNLTRSQTILGGLLGVFASFCCLEATFLTFNDSTLDFFLFVEVCAGISLTFFIFKFPKAAQWVSMLFFIPFMHSFLIICPAYSPIGSGNFYILVFAIAALIFYGWLLRDIKIYRLTIVSPTLFLLGKFYCLVLIYNMCRNTIESPEMASGVCLVVYSLIGLLAMFFGKDIKLRRSGLFLIIGVVVRLFCVEIWFMGTLNRIGTFLSIGLLLILTTFVNRKRHRSITKTQDDPQS